MVHFFKSRRQQCQAEQGPEYLVYSETPDALRCNVWDSDTFADVHGKKQAASRVEAIR